MSKNFERRLLEALANMHAEHIRTNMLLEFLMGIRGHDCSLEELDEALVGIAVTANETAANAMKELLERWKEEPDAGQ